MTANENPTFWLDGNSKPNKKRAHPIESAEEIIKNEKKVINTIRKDRNKKKHKRNNKPSTQPRTNNKPRQNNKPRTNKQVTIKEITSQYEHLLDNLKKIDHIKRPGEVDLQTMKDLVVKLYRYIKAVNEAFKKSTEERDKYVNQLIQDLKANKEFHDKLMIVIALNKNKQLNKKTFHNATATATAATAATAATNKNKNKNKKNINTNLEALLAPANAANAAVAVENVMV
jgi:hypothetical protein